MNTGISVSMAVVCAALLWAGAPAQIYAEEIDLMDPWNEEPIIGMYVHQHWSYNHPYAARTWTLEDWQGYLGGLRQIGYNTVLIWPVLETMPNPLTPGDQECLDKISRVIEYAHKELNMRVFIALCPNVVARDEEASKYSFVERPFFYCDRRIDPADAAALGQMISWRKQLFTPLKDADGVLIIDSDPGGYPGSNNIEFAYLLDAHRTMFNQLNPKIQLYYWIHVGWEAYCRFYATAEFAMGEIPEIHEALQYIAKINPEPWGIASGRGPHIADSLGMSSRVFSYQYGAIEGEPSFPMTNFNTQFAYKAGREKGARGTMGNSQTHCLQLPNAFLFARGALDQPVPRHEDYVEFANRLLPGHGETIVAAWEALDSVDIQAIEASIPAIEQLMNQDLETGDLKGLLFHDPQRFVKDLLLMQRTHLALEVFRTAAMDKPRTKDAGRKMLAFVEAISQWQKQHNYRNMLVWPRMEEALLQVDPGYFEKLFAERSYKGEGATPFEQVQNAYKNVESYTPRMIDAMRQCAENLISQSNE